MPRAPPPSTRVLGIVPRLRLGVQEAPHRVGEAHRVLLSPGLVQPFNRKRLAQVLARPCNVNVVRNLPLCGNAGAWRHRKNGAFRRRRAWLDRVKMGKWPNVSGQPGQAPSSTSSSSRTAMEV